MKINKDMKILIVGLGLLGGSYARALSKKGYKVSAITKEQSAVDYGLANGFVDKATTEISHEMIYNADFVIFALYPNVFIKWIEENQKHFRPGTVITDVTGVKCSVVYKIQTLLRDDVEFISAHPMAGRESSGIENSDDSVFKNANYIVVPTEKNTPEAIELCESLGYELGFKRISRLSPEKHDEMIAFLSQLTHCIAVSLMCSNGDEHLCEYTGDSFRDLTRIAKINEKMWSELFILNKEKLIDSLDLFLAETAKLRGYIADENAAGIENMMKLSTERRKKFDIV